jgi:hypothetical protein
MNKQKTKAQESKSSSMKLGLAVIGWAVIIGLFLYRPKWMVIALGIGFFGWIGLAILFLYFGFIFLKAKKAKEEGGWLFAIINAIGLMIFIALSFLLAFHVDKTNLP